MEIIDVQKAVIGALLIDKNAAIVVFSILKTPEAFSDSTCKEIYQAIERLYNQGESIDLIVVATELKKSGTLSKIGGPKTIASIASKISSSAHVDIHCRLLLEDFLRRNTIRLTQELLDKSMHETQDVFEAISKTQAGFEKLLEQTITGVEKTIAGTINLIRQKRETTKPDSNGPGLPSIISEINQYMGGFCPTDLIIVGGRPGQGKTSWLTSEALGMAKAGTPVGIFSLEMSIVQLVQRLSSNISSIEHEKIRSNRLNQLDNQRLNIFEDELSQLPIFIDDQPGMSVQSVRTKIHYWVRKHGVKIIFLDFLQKLSSSSRKWFNRIEELTEISSILKNTAKELEIPIVCLVALSREVEKRPTKIPIMSDIRDCGMIESDADSILFLMRPEYYGISQYEISGSDYDTQNLALGVLAKNRHGSTGEFPMKFNGALMRFTDYNQATPSGLPDIFDLPDPKMAQPF